MKYKVQIFDTYHKTFVYEVEADNSDVAEELAGELHNENPTLPTVDDFVEWQYDGTELIK